MLGTYRRIASLILPLCLAPAAPLCAQSGSQQSSQQDQDPVAEAARKAREQKKDQPKPKKVFDDDNIPRASRTEAPTPAQPAQGQQAGAGQTEAGKPAAKGEAAAQSGDAADGKQKSPEEIWRERFKTQHDKIAKAEKELDVLQRESDKAGLQYYSDPQKALMEQNSRKDINDKNTKIAAKQKEIEALKQQLSDMEGELRKSGGDIGWSRE